MSKVAKSFQLLTKVVKNCQNLPKIGNLTWCHDDTNDKMMKWWHNDTRHNDTMIWGNDDINYDMMTRWNDDMICQIGTYSYDLYTKLNDENDQQFCWNSIIVQCNLPPPNYGRPLHPKLPPNRMTYIPSTMIKMTDDFVEIASLSSVTYHRQIMVVHCTQNCHLLVWPIYKAQWWKWSTILLNQHHYPV